MTALDADPGARGRGGKDRLEPLSVRLLATLLPQQILLATLLPQQVLARVFRGKYLAGLKAAYGAGELKLVGRIAELTEPRVFAELLDTLHALDWVVTSRSPSPGRSGCSATSPATPTGSRCRTGDWYGWKATPWP